MRHATAPALYALLLLSSACSVFEPIVVGMICESGAWTEARCEQEIRRMECEYEPEKVECPPAPVD